MTMSWRQKNESLSNNRSLLKPYAIKGTAIDVDVETKLITKRTILCGHALQFRKIAAIVCGILFQFYDKQIVFRAIVPSMVNDNIRQNEIRITPVASSYAFEHLLHLPVAVVFAVDVPSGKT